jgi:LytTr DNA-binding domain
MSSHRSKIRVLIVSECDAYLASARELLLSHSDLEIVGLCSQVGALPQAVATNDADLVLWASPNAEAQAGHGGSYDGFQLLAMPVARCFSGVSSQNGFPPNHSIAENDDIHEVFAAGDAVPRPQNELQSGHQIEQAVEQVRRFLNLELSSSVFPELENKAAARDRLCIKSRGRILFLVAGDIRWIEGAGNYLRIHLESESHMVRETISDFEARLDPARFVRIHRSVIVNLDAVREMRPWPTGEYVVTLKDGKELTLSRSYRSCVVRLTSNDPATGRPPCPTRQSSPSSSLSRVVKQTPSRNSQTARVYGN